MKKLVVLFAVLFFFNSFSQTRQIVYPPIQSFLNLADTIYSQIIWLGDDYNSLDYEYLFNHWYQPQYDIHLTTTEGHHILFTDINNNGSIDMIGNSKTHDSSEVGYAEYKPNSVPIFNLVSSFPDTNIFTEVLVDLNNDGKNEIITGSHYPFVNAFDNHISFIRNLPVRGQWGNTKPLIADIDGNNNIDFVVDQNINNEYSINFFEYDYANDTLNIVTKIDSMMYKFIINGDTVDTLIHVRGDFSDYVFNDLDDDGFIEVATGHVQGFLNIFEKDNIGYRQEYFNNMGTYNMYQIAITNDINLNGKNELIVIGDYDGGPLFWLEADSMNNYSVIRKDFIDYGNNISIILMTMYATDVDLDGKDELVFRQGSLIWILKWNAVENKWDMLFFLDTNRDYDSMWGNGHNRSFPGHVTNVEFYDIDNDGDNDMFVSTDEDITLFFESNLSILGVDNPFPNILPERFNLSQNYPNPFNPVTKIKYSIPKASNVSLVVYDVLGNEITTLVNEEKTAGSYEVHFDGTSLSSGVYFYVMNADNFVDTKKLILIK